MKTIGALIVLAICSGCGGSSVPPGALSAPASVTATVLPERAVDAKSNQFEYVINDYGSYASIFDYPTGTKQIGTISNVGGQGCTNVLYGVGKKTFWIMAGADQMTEYEVPKKPVKTLSIATGQPSGCAMDEQGDLAVGDLTSGSVIIFKDASGPGTVIPTDLAMVYFVCYDDKGNLFFDGLNKLSHFELYEIPNGSNKFESIAASNIVDYPGSVQWDGKYVTVLDQVQSSIYRYTVKGTAATLKSTVTLKGAGDCTQTWIATGIVFCADAGNDDGEVYAYPAGGSPIAVLSGKFDLPLGAVAVRK
jgi:hypothetical protein